MLPKSIRNRFLLLAALIIAAVVSVAPSFTGNLPSGWQKYLPSQGMRLGLDLQGGMYLILKVDIPRAIQHHLDMAVADLGQTLHKEHLPARPSETASKNSLRLQVIEPDKMPSIVQLVKDKFPDLQITGQGADYLELGLAAKEIKSIQDNAVDQSLEILRNRIDQFGVEEPAIVRQGKDEIVVQLPGVKDPQRAMELIGRTAQLEFKLVDQSATIDLNGLIQRAVESGRLQSNYSHQQLNAALKANIPPGDEIYIEKNKDPQTGIVSNTPMLLKRQVLMTGDALKTAGMRIGGRYGEPYVSLTLNDRGAKQFAGITRDNVDRRLAIILDDIVQSAPVIQEPITGGTAQITGSFTAAQAHDLAIVLRAGALPAPVQIIQNLTVGPSLGKDSIHKGLASTILGTILVLAFMVIYYRLSGVIANFALLLNLVLMLAALSVFHATLTLPGIAGIVLSIGMAVDSNVLIFERMREELALNKPVYTSVAAGYDKALWTIIDAHVTTLITALALFLFGTGPIKGFAVTLSIGVLLNLFTALYGTRVVYDFLHFKRRLTHLKFLHIIRKPQIDFIRLRNVAFVLSGLFVFSGILAFAQIERGRANLGVDFSGGTTMQFKAEKPFQLDAVRSALTQHNMGDYELQEVPGEDILIVRIKKTEQSMGAAAHEELPVILDQSLPGNHFTLESKAEIGASVSKDLKHAALIAIGISLAGIIVYLAWRFDRRFGVAAAIATFHDVLTVLGVFYLLDKEITLLVVTALLTLAGYSLTDTVVVFDRIRENMHKNSRLSFKEIINMSINEVLSRTIITSCTVFIVLLALLLMGGVLLHDFALALLIGVVVGTYSSVFVASPIVYIWENAAKRRMQSKRAGRKKPLRHSDQKA